MKVLAWPAYKTRYKNPYNWLLYSPMQAFGITVDEFAVKRLLLQRYDVIHIHWPVETIVRHPRFAVALARVVVFIGLLRWAKWRGTRIIWTIHDETPHVLLHQRLARWCEQLLSDSVDATINLCKVSQTCLQANQPALARKPSYVVPHGHYRDVYPTGCDRSTARQKLEIPASAQVCLYLGYISPYKNVPHLVKTFRQLPDEQLRLLIVGKPDTEDLAAAIAKATADDPRVMLHLKFVADTDLQTWFAAADLVVLPFTEILNSGSALMALSFDRPVLVPHLGAIPELQQQVGPGWVQTYQGELTPERLAQALATGSAPPLETAPLAALDWKTLSQQTVDIYRAVCQGVTFPSATPSNRVQT